MTCNIVRLFVNILTADGKYSLLNRDNLAQRIQMYLSQKQKDFSRYTFTFLRFSLNFDHLKKMTLIAYVFPKLRTPKNVVE